MAASQAFPKSYPTNYGPSTASDIAGGSKLNDGFQPPASAAPITRSGHARSAMRDTKQETHLRTSRRAEERGRSEGQSKRTDTREQGQTEEGEESNSEGDEAHTEDDPTYLETSSTPNNLKKTGIAGSTPRESSRAGTIKKPQKEPKNNPRKERKKNPNTKTALKKKVAEARKELNHYQSRCKELEAVIKENSSKFEVLEDEKDKKYDNLKASTMRLINKGMIKFDSDEDVRYQVSNVKGLWKPWAKAYAKDSWEEMNQKEPNACLKAMSETGELLSAAGTRFFVQSRKAPSILLNTLLAHMICKKIFTNPFFFLDDGPDDHGNAYPVGAKEGLLWLLEICKDIDVAKTSAWRAQIMQLLNNTTSQENTIESLRSTAHIRELKQKAYRRITTSIENSSMKDLMRPLSTSETVTRYTELLDIVSRTGELALRLWMQRVDLKVLSLSALPERTFSIGSLLMEPHRTLMLDSDDTSMDGLPVEHVVEPAIIAYGNADGENYDHYKIWSKATVLVHQIVPPTSTPLTRHNQVHPATVHADNAIILAAAEPEENPRGTLKIQSREPIDQTKQEKASIVTPEFQQIQVLCRDICCQPVATAISDKFPTHLTTVTGEMPTDTPQKPYPKLKPSSASNSYRSQGRMSTEKDVAKVPTKSPDPQAQQYNTGRHDGGEQRPTGWRRNSTSTAALRLVDEIQQEAQSSRKGIFSAIMDEIEKPQTTTEQNDNTYRPDSEDSKKRKFTQDM